MLYRSIKLRSTHEALYSSPDFRFASSLGYYAQRRLTINAPEN